MDIGKLLKNINSLNEYVIITQDASEKCKNSKIPLNMTTVLALKKIRSFEIEHVNKCEENGIACVIFERMLCLPPSKTWGVLSKEMVNLLQYWLDAVRKHLVKHSSHWWSFLKLLLGFIKAIRQKDSSLPSMLVEHTAECLLDLATNNRPDAMQRYEILHCFNMYCSESSREIRFALRSKFGNYFTKLSTYMHDCGHLPTQYSIMETLLRWLLPRQDRTLRIMSATKWFPARLYADSTVDIFLERPWMNFFEDARDFLNSHNERSDLITSVVIRKLSVGDVVVITDSEDSWLDINSSTKCISVLLDPRMLDEFGCSNHKSFETLVVINDNTHAVNLYRESGLLTLSLQTSTPPQVLPSCMKLGDDVSCHVTAVVSSHCDVKRLDQALRNVFEDKYQLIINLDEERELSPKKGHSSQNKEVEDTRFSHPVEVRKRKHSGYQVLKKPLSCLSPSTASTSSLAQLHEKLAALPRFRFDKEPQSVCALPELSIVSEVSETDERSISTHKYKPYGVSDRRHIAFHYTRKSQSDNETNRTQFETKESRTRRLSPVIQDSKWVETSCLLVATIGSADDSVINDTVERLSKSKDYNPDNIVDLLVQEALNAKLEQDKGDSGIHISDKKSQDANENCDAIDNTPNEKVNVTNKANSKGPKVISSTSDESNTEAISDTPNVYVNTRRKKKELPEEDAQLKSFDIQMVEDFFGTHFTENRAGDIVISPSLAKKINETSSETTDHLDQNYILADNDLQDVKPYDFNNIEVLECLNSMVDKVCDEFHKCTKYLNNEEAVVEDNDTDFEDNIPLKDILNKIKDTSRNPKKIKTKSKKQIPKKIKLKYKVTPKENMSLTKRKNKTEKENISKMSTIIEDNAEILSENSDSVKNKDKRKYENVEQHSASRDITDVVTPNIRRKRKLYSPKDEQLAQEAPFDSATGNCDFTDTKIRRTPTSTTSYKPYKDIEKERQRHIRMPRNRWSKKAGSLSPRSKKMNDLFNKVKEFVNGEQVTLADKGNTYEVFNFSSDSEADFEMTKNAKKNRTSLDSVESTAVKTKRGRPSKRSNELRKNQSETTKCEVNKKQKGKKRTDIEPVQDLIDERMRETNEILNTSFHRYEKPVTLVKKLQLELEQPPEMELITEIDVKCNEDQPKPKRSKKNKTKPADLAKNTKRPLNFAANVDNDRTESPLPGLVIEEVLPTKNKTDGDISNIMVDKIKKICQNPEKYINESNTTHNLLSDNERITFSPRNVDITNEFTKLEVRNKAVPQSIKNTTKTKKTAYNKRSEDPVVLEPVIEVIQTLDFETKSEKSIATDGITGHGDSDEPPPSPLLITERLEHRNLEIEYWDDSTKDYFDNLRKEIYDIIDVDGSSDNGSNASNKSIKPKKKKGDSVRNTSERNNDDNFSKSPVVSITRLSGGDISKWLPSRRNSDSDVISQKSSDSKQANSRKELVIRIPRLKNVASSTTTDSDENSEVVEAVRRSLIPTHNNSPVFKVNTRERRKIQYKKVNLNESDKKNSKMTKNPESPSESDSDESTNSIQKEPKTKQNKFDCDDDKNNKAKKQAQNVERVQTPRNAKCKPLSIISPIKLFEELISNADKMSQTLSEDEEYINEIKCTKSKRTKKSSIRTRSSIEDKDSVKDIRSSKRENKKINDEETDEEVSVNMVTHKEQMHSDEFKKRNNRKSFDSNVSNDSSTTSDKLDPEQITPKLDVSKTTKRRLNEDSDGSKKKRVNNNNISDDITEGSGETGYNSVDKWFHKNMSIGNQVEELDMSIKETIIDVFQKLDTTFNEINKNSTNKHLHLFMTARRRLKDLHKNRNRMYKVVAATFLSKVVRLIDDTFAEIDKRSKKHDIAFIEEMKKETAEVIRQDYLQKSTMIKMLRDDMQTVIQNRFRRK